MSIVIDGNNFFHNGWLACLFGLPRIHPHSDALKACDRQAFIEGWLTCHETSLDLRAFALAGMIEKGQAEAIWVEGDR